MEKMKMRERKSFDGVTFDSSIHCGNGHGFQRVERNLFRFWSRAGGEPYSWRFYFKIESPGDGREVILEVADFNHAGRTPWHEGASSYSSDCKTWREIGTQNIEIAPFTPPEHPLPYGDSSHIPYGVKHRLKLTHPEMWFASSVPFTLEDQDKLFERLARDAGGRAKIESLGGVYHSEQTGYGMKGVRISDHSVPPDKKIRCLIIAGEHPAETAGIRACAGMAEKFSLSPELMREFDICFMPLSNPDGAFLGRTYHNSVPGDPDGPGYNILMDYKDEKHPETQNIGRYADSFKPHVFLRLHNGRHRKAFDIWLSEEYLSPPITEELRKSMSVEIAAFHPLSSKKEMLYERHSVPIVMVFETLLLKKNPGCDNFKDSYIKTGEDILGGLTNALRRMRSALLETQK